MEALEGLSESELEQLGQLRAILLGTSFEEVLTVVARLEDPDARAHYVAEVLAEAVKLRSTRGDALARALSGPVAEAVRTSVETDPQPIVNAIFPVIGPAIRRSVSEMISSMAERVTTMVDQSFSPRGLQWRFEAWRSGLPFGEVVLRNTLLFRVEQVFWIHRKTGLLLLHASSTGRETEDPDMISGMLTAIRDFMRDSFEAEGQEVRSMEMGDCRLVVRDGPVSSLAALVRGPAPVELSNVLHETLEDLHLQYGSELNGFDGDVDPLESAEPALRACLISQLSDAESSRGRRLMPWLLSALLITIVAAWGFQRAQESRQQEWLEQQRLVRWHEVQQSLRGIPGVVVIGAERSATGYRIEGLRDPIAQLPEAGQPLDQPLTLSWRPFVSLDPPIVTRRAEAALAPPDGIEVALRDETLVLSGEAPVGWLRELASDPPTVQGVAHIDVGGVLPTIESEAGILSTLPLDFQLGRTRLAPEAVVVLETVAREFLAMASVIEPLGWQPDLRITGSADRRGDMERNFELASERAEAVAAVLLEAGVREGWLHRSAKVSPSDDDLARRASLDLRLKPHTASGEVP